MRRQMRKLADEIVSRSAWTDVECERRVADDNSLVELVRLDTGEVLETEPATDADRQMELDELTAEVDQQVEFVQKARDRYDEAQERISEDAASPNPRSRATVSAPRRVVLAAVCEDCDWIYLVRNPLARDPLTR